MNDLRALSECRLCGYLVEADVPSSWAPDEVMSYARNAMQEHLGGHAPAELVRFQIRENLSELPEDDRSSVIRGIYRELLGRMEGDTFVLGKSDSQGLYTIDEVLGSIDFHRLYQSSIRCESEECCPRA